MTDMWLFSILNIQLNIVTTNLNIVLFVILKFLSIEQLTINFVIGHVNYQV